MTEYPGIRPPKFVVSPHAYDRVMERGALKHFQQRIDFVHRELCDAHENHRFSSTQPRWCAGALRKKHPQIRYFWNEDLTRCYVTRIGTLKLDEREWFKGCYVVLTCVSTTPDEVRAERVRVTVNDNGYHEMLRRKRMSRKARR